MGIAHGRLELCFTSVADFPVLSEITTLTLEVVTSLAIELLNNPFAFLDRLTLGSLYWPLSFIDVPLASRKNERDNLINLLGGEIEFRHLQELAKSFGSLFALVINSWIT